MSFTVSRIIHAVLCFAIAFLVSGCPPKRKVIKSGTAEAVAESSVVVDTTVEIGTDWAVPSVLEPVYFDSDRADLRPESRQALKRNAAALKALLQEVPTAQIRIEGHCDERSTLEYNLALGQRRANAVREYYAALGLKKSSLSALSYGEERPVCAESSEGCWRRNRRGDTAVRSPGAPVRIPLERLRSSGSATSRGTEGG